MCHKTSSVKIQVYCERCGNIKTMHPSNYYDGLTNDKYYCYSCKRILFRSKENSPRWNPNIPQAKRIKERDCLENILFTKNVLCRDNYICQKCGSKADVVHHLDGYNWCIDRRFDETNGISLCKTCHKNFHAMYGYGNNTENQFFEWFGRPLVLSKNTKEVVEANPMIYIENGIILPAKEMANKLNLNSFIKLYDICNHKALTIDNYHFMYYAEYLNLPNRCISNIIEFIQFSHYITMYMNNKIKTDKLVIDIMSGCVYFGVKDAEKKCGIYNVSACCRHKQRSCFNKATNKKYVFIYFSDFLKLSGEEQLQIISKNKESWFYDSLFYLVNKEGVLFG